MIYTDRFVYVHLPKTGGTTVTTALLRLHDIRWSRWMHLKSMYLPELRFETPHGQFVYTRNKHGTCSDIAATERGKPILGTTRSPYARYVSQYTFGWWKRREYHRYYRALPGFEARFPDFPDLSFADFLTLINEAFGTGGETGRLTRQFVEFYSQTPEATLARLGADPEADLDLFDVHYLRTEHLNTDLHDYLVAVGYAPDDVAFVQEMGRVLPGGKGRPKGESWRKYVTPDLQAIIRNREAPLFALFPEYDVS